MNISVYLNRPQTPFTGALASGDSESVQLYLWEKYDANDDLIYPNIDGWESYLKHAEVNDAYSSLTSDELLSILFGLMHRDRIVEGLWNSKFDSGVVHKLIKSLEILESVNSIKFD